ncbi:MAG: hypothetical protein ACR2JB_00205 [Bryobacteraceae bacterium]
MKTRKALKKLSSVEAVLSDVLERYATDVTEVREQLDAAAAALRRARSAIDSNTSNSNPPTRKSSGRRTQGKKASAKRAPRKTQSPAGASA